MTLLARAAASLRQGPFPRVMFPQILRRQMADPRCEHKSWPGLLQWLASPQTSLPSTRCCVSSCRRWVPAAPRRAPSIYIDISLPWDRLYWSLRGKTAKLFPNAPTSRGPSRSFMFHATLVADQLDLRLGPSRYAKSIQTCPCDLSTAAESLYTGKKHGRHSAVSNLSLLSGTSRAVQCMTRERE